MGMNYQEQSGPLGRIQCCMIEMYQRFEGTYCLRHQVTSHHIPKSSNILVDGVAYFNQCTLMMEARNSYESPDTFNTLHGVTNLSAPWEHKNPHCNIYFKHKLRRSKLNIFKLKKKQSQGCKCFIRK